LAPGNSTNSTGIGSTNSNIQQAAKELVALQAIMATTPSPLPGMLHRYALVANYTLSAAIAGALSTSCEKRTDPGCAVAAFLVQAVAEQESWAYDEPPPWHVPMRQCLGRVELLQHQYAQAESTFRDDLKEFPSNGFSLFGLLQAVKAQVPSGAHTPADVAAIQNQLDKSWARADVRLSSSCLLIAPGAE
jgi:hypothetical protein